MRISATGTSIDVMTKQRGFTLLELLVVVVIIGVLASMIVLRPESAGEARELHEEARRLAALTELAAEDAVMNSRELALTLTPQGYGFETYEAGEWRPLNDDVLRQRRLPAGMQLAAQVEGEPMTESARVLLLSSGEVSPFTAALSYGAAVSARVEADASGVLRVIGGG